VQDIDKVLSALEKGTFTKIIFGAANTNKKQIERLALIYALGGADVVDVAATDETINAAQCGINKATEIFKKHPEQFPNFNEPLIMASINCKDELHFRKAKIDAAKCINCKECINSCPAKAIQEHCYCGQPKAQIKTESCYGCGICERVCLHQAVDFENFNNCPTQINANIIKGIEIHTGGSSIEDLRRFLELHKALFKNIKLLSFSVESKKYSYSQLIDYVNAIVSLISQKVIIQIDGISMSATDEPSSSLQTIASAGILLDSKINAYIQLAGGTNHYTKNLAQQLNLKISGIGYGTFARKILLSYIEESEDSIFAEQLLQKVNIATSLVRS